MINDLNKEVTYLRNQLNKYTENNLKTSSQTSKKKSINIMSSYEFTNANGKHERLLSERITKFYTPKANELIRNFNTNSNQFISSRSKHSNVLSASKTKKKTTRSNTVNNRQTLNKGMKDVKERMNLLINKLFTMIEKK